MPSIGETLPAPIVQAAVESAASKYCCSPSTAIGTLILSVAGIALSIFNGSLYGFLGFLLLGIISYVVWSRSKDQVTTMTTEIAQRTNETAAALTAANKDLEAQVTALDANSKALGVQVKGLQDDLVKRAALEKRLEGERDKMAHEVEELGHTKVGLEQDLAAMKENSTQVAQRVQELVTQNLTLGRDLGVFQATADGIDHHEATMRDSVQKFENGFQGDLTALSAELAVGKEVSGELLKKVAAKNDEIQQQLEQSRAQSARERAALEADAARLAREQADLNDTVARLETEKRDFTASLEQLRTANATQTAQFREAEAKLQTDLSGITKLKETEVRVQAKLDELKAIEVRLREDARVKAGEGESVKQGLQQQVTGLQAQVDAHTIRLAALVAAEKATMARIKALTPATPSS